ncbi:non-specific lipid-transfer protein 5-like [Vicia villosa]|uniref:non-specific lipid-transfer protein 5-like n=1 Tax=Vicia villosa TaxID=3911 RepID=UPI00273BD56A|nr:non-specific lipid-transfer protein 5-like [Vicia villosa]
MARSMKVACVVLVMCMAFAHMAESAITCEDVVNNHTPCIGGYTGGIMISTRCCNAVKKIDAAATTAADRQLTCRCLKIRAGYILNLDPNIGDKLFVDICGAKTPYKLNRNADCSTIKTKEVVADAGLSNILTTI